MPLHCYGENSFTFLLFRELADCDGFQKFLIPSLQPFGREQPNPFSEVKCNDEPDILLFPNFGRRYGFGEPDALVLWAGFSFWFEVETWVHLATARPAMNDSLLQLARFHFFHEALQRVITRRGPPPHEAICGLTVSNNRRAKMAVLKIAGHPVLQRFRKRLADSTPHYVLLSYGQPQGPGGNNGFAATALNMLEELSLDCCGAFAEWRNAGYLTNADPKRIPNDRFWYTYWSGHLANRFVNNPLDQGGFVPIPG